ncbi:chaperone/heat shock protein-like protein Hsp12 [Melanomma pulvis-pyrius CBS 109.77]|uniref:Chaperone/heat shock protein-like protein Hsp12 n=1 Tax=Melanomma pulvis-pyrius CBS 109.77 TaxID=1314802 RepID=A0A6A6XD52_9PLEO|nr:chaperone/heat shock protein-like protein Hsp12 [Melanomma pulvis-pyrius CBS 109.77]
MSDLGRKGFGEQAKEKVTPDSQKSTLDQATETITGLGDRAAGAVQPQGDKSATQKLGDSTRSGTDDASNQGQGILADAQNVLGNAAQSVSDTLSGTTKK